MFKVLRRSMGRAGMCYSQSTRPDYISPKRWTIGIRNLESFLSNLLKLAPTLGSIKSSIPHGAWRLFFSNFLLKLEYTWTIISTVGILV
jgi:hypothetical protein